MNENKGGRVCPKCGKIYHEYPAISRRDNETEICNKCSMEEAMNDILKILIKENVK